MPANLDPTTDEFRDGSPTGRVIVDRDELISLMSRAYRILAPIENQWKGRGTLEGQTLLCDLRENIARLTGEDSMPVQARHEEPMTVRKDERNQSP